MWLFGRLIKHGLFFVTRAVVGSQIYFNSLNNSASLNDTRKKMLNKGGHVQDELYFPFSCQHKSDYPGQLNICTKGKKCSFDVKLKIMIFKNCMVICSIF